MTFLELRQELKKLKYTSNIYLNLFPEYHNTAEVMRIAGLYVIKNCDIWEVFEVDERGSKKVTCKFCTENDVCEYIHCFFKEISDHNRWF